MLCSQLSWIEKSRISRSSNCETTPTESTSDFNVSRPRNVAAWPGLTIFSRSPNKVEFTMDSTLPVIPGSFAMMLPRLSTVAFGDFIASTSSKYSAGIDGR
mgnify:CR=1 FL=1